MLGFYLGGVVACLTGYLMIDFLDEETNLVKDLGWDGFLAVLLAILLWPAFAILAIAGTLIELLGGTNAKL